MNCLLCGTETTAKELYCSNCLKEEEEQIKKLYAQAEKELRGEFIW